MKALDAMKNASHEQLMAMGRGSLRHLKTGEVLENEPPPPDSALNAAPRAQNLAEIRRLVVTKDHEGYEQLLQRFLLKQR